MKALFLTFVVSLFSFGFSFAQEEEEAERKSINVNEIEVWTKGVQLTANGDTAIVELYLQSYLKNPREFKMNTFASGVVGSEDRPMWYHTMQLGKVLVRLEDRQNYLRYLLTRDTPVVLTIKTPNWNKQWGTPKQVRLAIEDYAEEGKILEYTVDL